MITHCPYCHTHFRVRAEQLAVRAGQVRCGKCGRAFDALEHLIEEKAAAAAPGSTSEPDAPRTNPAEAARLPELSGEQVQQVGGEGPPPLSVEATDARVEPAGGQAETRRPSTPEPMTGVSAASATAFSFGPTAAAESAGPRRRWLWLAGALLLLLLLLAQAAYQYRGAVTLIFPETKPYAVALCATLRCDLPLPRRIDLISIEASDLQADTTNPNVMVLSATLKNRAVFGQQHPSLELTLTDAQDQPVVRRVLAPPDYLGKAAGAQAGFGANTEIAIKVYIEGSQVKATGYRLYLFYP
jgi:predicted Zn finger-like uncharacterized protein